MKWIIIEGPDNVGKSTFIANELSKYLATKDYYTTVIDHIGGPKTNNPKEEMKKLAYDYIKHMTPINLFTNNSVLVNDRSIFGELVYSMYRHYQPDYMKDIVKLISAHNIEVLFVLIYADKDTYKKFDIPNKKEVKEYESNDQSRLISSKFIEEIHKLALGRVVVINSNNYDSLNQRNLYLLKHIDAFLSNKKYEFKCDDSYKNIPFNNKQRFFANHIDSYGFVPQSDVNVQECVMYHDLDCELGLEHKRTSDYGVAQNIPTNGFGSLTGVKYVFVGEAPAQKGCGTLGIPFYGDVSGNLFMSALYENNISLFNCYITNAIKCCPENNDLKSYYKVRNAKELECVNKLKSELDAILIPNRLSTLYAVGSTAFEVLSILYRFRQDIKIKKIYHPAYYVRMGNLNKYHAYLHTQLMETK